MLERIRKAQKDERGFTLIELLIVIVILGILAAIVVFAVGSTRKDSVASSCKTDVKSVQLSAEAVNTKSGSFPAATGTGGGDNLLASADKGGLLKTWPTSSDYTLTYALRAAAGTTPAGYDITVGGSNVVGGTVRDIDDKTVLDAKCAGK